MEFEERLLQCNLFLFIFLIHLEQLADLLDGCVLFFFSLLSLFRMFNAEAGKFGDLRKEMAVAGLGILEWICNCWNYKESE